jgi:hypothetical protein
MKKNVKIISVIVVALILVGLIYLALSQKSANGPTGSNGSNTANVPAGVPKEMLNTQTPAAASETQKLINEATQGASSTQTISVSQPGTNGSTTPTTTQMKVVTVSPGTSPINVATGQVVTPTGQAVNNAAQASSPQAPAESFPITDGNVPSSAIKLQVTSTSFTPNTFTVNRGQAVSLVISNVNTSTFSEVFRFDDPSLSGVVVGLAKGETKTITFNAPAKAGEYVYFSSMFDHRAQGAVGKMIVK